MRGYEDYKEILNKFTQLLRKRIGDNLISIVLYGSVARGAAKDESDIDILIILKEAPAAYYERLEPVIDIELKMRESVPGAPPIFSSLILSKEEAMENRNIFLDMIEDSIILYDKDDFFRNRLKAMKNRLQELGSRKFILKDNTWYWQLKPDLKAGEILEL